MKLPLGKYFSPLRGFRVGKINYNQRAFWFFFLSPELIFKLRSGIYYLLCENFIFTPKQKVLDLGVEGGSDDYFHKLYPYKKNITAAGLAHQSEQLKRDYPEIKYLQIKDKFPYKFKSLAYDFIHSSAVIEHVGSRKKQQRFLEEVYRIGKSGAITTPNRWFPLEFHTFLPLIHWLPAKIYRKVFRAFGFEFYSQEKNLNLLEYKSLRILATNAKLKKYKIINKKIFGITSNFILIWKRN